MYFVYVLYSKSFHKIYIGYTNDLQRRLVEHNTSQKGYTRRFRPWLVIHTEQFMNKTDAMKREKELKTSQGRSFIREKLLTGII